MIRSFLLNKYLGKEFITTTLIITIVFLFLGVIMNLFEEINFFKDLDVSIYLPIMLTFLFVPTLLNNFFPFVIFAIVLKYLLEHFFVVRKVFLH